MRNDDNGNFYDDDEWRRLKQLRGRVDNETPWDEYLRERWELLKSLHEQLEDVLRGMMEIETLIDDVRILRDAAKRDYDTF